MIDAGERLGPFILNHEPGAARGGYALAGHIHPAVRPRVGDQVFVIADDAVLRIA